MACRLSIIRGSAAAQTMNGNGILDYRRFLYLKIALAIAAASTVAWFAAQPGLDSFELHFGGTPTGYALGIFGAALILLLTWFGVRKRSYRSSLGTAQGWLSAHVYLGLALVVVATLHTGFQYGWNVHTLAYVLMLLVIGSGLYGLVVYVRLPSQITRNQGEDTLDGILLTIADLDRDAHRTALELPDVVLQLVARASEQTRIGGSVFEQLRGIQKDCPTEGALAGLEKLSATFHGKSATIGTNLFGLLARRAVLVRRARRDIQLRALLSIWLYFHVPLTLGLLAALAAHVLSVFFYR